MFESSKASNRRNLHRCCPSHPGCSYMHIWAHACHRNWYLPSSHQTRTRSQTNYHNTKTGFLHFHNGQNMSLFFTLKAFFSAVQSTTIPVVISNIAIGGEVIIPTITKGESRFVFTSPIPPIVAWQLPFFLRVHCILFTIW